MPYSEVKRQPLMSLKAYLMCISTQLIWITNKQMA